MKCVLLAAVLLVLGMSSAPVGADIAPGQLAFVMANSDAPDSFAWVTLAEIIAGTTLYFTDSSYGNGDAGGLTAAYHRWTEHLDGGGPLSWSNSSSLAAGTVVTWDGSAWNTGTAGGSTISAANSGDQLFAYQGTIVSNNAGPSPYQGDASGVTYFYGMVFSGGDWITTGAGGSGVSYLPPSLSGHALSLGSADNWIYTGSRTGTVADLQAALGNAGNWSSDNTTARTWTDGNFEIVPEPGTLALLALGLVGLTARCFARRVA